MKTQHNGKRIEQGNKKFALCHIRWVKDHGGHLVNQPHLKLIGKWQKRTVENKISTVSKQSNEQTQNTLRKNY